MIRWKHDTSESLYIVKLDTLTMKQWEAGKLTAEEAAKIIAKNNDLGHLDPTVFVIEAHGLGYWREEDER